MAVLGVLTYPWIMKMHVFHPESRVRILADDALVGTGLEDDLSEDMTFQLHDDAVQTSAMFMKDLGARIAPKKSSSLPSTPSLRARWKKHVIQALSGPLPVCLTIRDLGAQLSVGRVYATKTLSERLEKASRLLESSKHMPMSFANRVAVILGKFFPMAIYGAPTTPIAKAKMQGFRSKLATTLDPRAAKARNVHLALACASGKVLDPRCHVLAARVLAIRRGWYVTPWTRHALEQVLAAHCEAGSVSTRTGSAANAMVDMSVMRGVVTLELDTSETRLQGPVALLLASLRDHGLTIDSAWNMHDQHGSVLNVLQVPYQRLKPATLWFAQRAANFANEQRLESIRGNGQIHWPTTHNILADLTAPDAILMRRIWMNGVWTQTMIDAMAMAEDTPCKWCGAPQQSHYHLFWECGRFSHLREAIWGEGGVPSVDSMPPCLSRCGLAPEPMLSYSEPGGKPVWGHIQGVYCDERAILQQHNQGVIDALQALRTKRGELPPKGSVDLLARLIQGSDQHEDMPQVHPCHELPPNVPNCYVDGSVFPPQQPNRASLGIGIACPHEPRQVMFEGQHLLFLFGQEGEGYHTFWTHVDSTRPSSSRAEALGLCLALGASGPLHLAIDNASVVRRANAILRGGEPQRHVMLTKDGDVWAIITERLSNRGLSSTKVTWIRGHTTPADVEAGKITARYRHFNEVVDRSAGLGRTGHGPWAPLWSWISGQEQRYNKFVRQVQDTLLGVLKALIRLNNDPMVRASMRPFIVYQPGSKEEEDPGEPFDLLRGQVLFNQAIPMGIHKAFHAFLFERPWQKRNGGISWVELLVLFYCSGADMNMLVPELGGQRYKDCHLCQACACVPCAPSCFCVHPCED